MGNKAVLEDIRQRKMFFASYPLGVNAGYREYVECVVTAQQEIKEKLGITGTDVLLYDPSKRAGYPGLAEGAGEHITRTGAHITLNGVPNHASNKALTLSLVNKAQTTLFSEENVYASLVLRPVVQNLSFIGGANFWWHMGPDQDKKKVTDEEEEEEEGGDFRLSALFKRWKKRRGLTHQQFHAKYEIPKSLIKNKDNEIFLARWVLQALSAAFGFDPRGKEELKVTFTPYNGPDGNRFSWTLGTAVLLSWDDKHLPQD